MVAKGQAIHLFAEDKETRSEFIQALRYIKTIPIRPSIDKLFTEHARKFSSVNSVAETEATAIDEIPSNEDTKRITIKRGVISKTKAKVRIVSCKRAAEGDDEATVVGKERNRFSRTPSRNRAESRCGSARADHPFAINYKLEQKKEAASFVINAEDKEDFNKFLDSISKSSHKTMVGYKIKNMKANPAARSNVTHRSCIRTVKLAKPKENSKANW